jgi:hypothetical protein
MCSAIKDATTFTTTHASVVALNDVVARAFMQKSLFQKSPLVLASSWADRGNSSFGIDNDDSQTADSGRNPDGTCETCNVLAAGVIHDYARRAAANDGFRSVGIVA